MSLHNESNYIKKYIEKKRLKSKATYAGIFLLWLIGYFMIMYIEKSAGSANVFFALGLVITGVSLATAIFIPNDRDKTISFFKTGMLGFTLYTILFDFLILVLNLSMDGNSATISSMITQVMTYTRIFVPLGLILWQAKKWTFLFGIKRSKRDTLDDIKDHGNDGMHF